MPATSKGLSEYRAKRSADRTPEPFDARAAPRTSGALRFVVQKHAARRLHYDFRLELGGVLVSWAVPRGPSFDPAEKRLAVHVEDHPLDYADFEGVIPKGNYGAGPVIVWDEGLWMPAEDPDRGMGTGKIVFDLRGYKLHGRWTLVRTKGKGDEWLLIKQADEWSGRKVEPGPESVLSGLTIEELRDGNRRSEEIAAELRRLGAPARRVRAADVDLMLATARDEPFSDGEWLFELKYDGFRIIVARDGDHASLRFRGGRDATSVFPELARAIARLPCDQFILDGELVVCDREGRPSFQSLQKRVQLARATDVARASLELPASIMLFDLLAFDGLDVRPLPLVERKRCLRGLVPRAGALRFADHMEGRGRELFGEIERLGLEGMVAKRASAPYRGGRSTDWLKIRVDRSGDFAVIGFTRPQGTRFGFGALHLGAYDGGALVYAGRVGTGFTDREVDDVTRRLGAAPRVAPPARGHPPKGAAHTWVVPELVCEVRYREWTEEGLLRQPVFLRFRDDKSPAECILPASTESAVEPEPPADPPAPDPSPRRIELTHPEKVFWPADGYTKRDLFEYYRVIAPSILPWLRDRPIVLTRYPDGIDGKSFYQKDAPGYGPAWIRTERIWSEHAARDIDYFICDDVESLLYLVNLGTIPLHVWASRTTSLTGPDWCVLDLDPKGAPFRDVVRIALAIRDLCEEITLPTFVKTSGSTGLHVLIPLAGQCTYEQSRILGELLSGVIVKRLPDIATITRQVRARGGKVYVDYLQNRHGQTIAAPFSVRPLAGAPVSTPLRWSEVGPSLDPQRFTIRTVPARVRRWKGDPSLGVLDARADLVGALERLANRSR